MKTTLGLLVLALPFVCVADVVVPVDEVETFVNIRQAPEAGTEIVGRLQRGLPLEYVGTVDGLSTMAIVAVLTRVIQDQQQRIDELEARIAD